MEKAADIWHPTVSVLPKRPIQPSPPPPSQPIYPEDAKSEPQNSTTSSGHSSSLSNGDIELESANGTTPKVEWPEVGKLPGLYNSRHDAAMILIFLKWFDVDNQIIRGIRPIYVNRHDKTGKLTPIIAELMGWRADGEQPVNIAFFEEIKPGMIEPLKPNSTFVGSEIQDGDIICFMRAQTSKRYGHASPLEKRWRMLILFLDWMNWLKRANILIQLDIMNFFIIKLLLNLFLDIRIK